MFFALQPNEAVLNDINAELIAFYKTLAKSPRSVIDQARRLSNSKRCYYQTRANHSRSAGAAAARFLYLNRTCWGGLYRTNRHGHFNVPFGSNGRDWLFPSQLRRCAELLKNAELCSTDFECIIDQSAKGDVVFADPPYATESPSTTFLRYNRTQFDWQDQIRLSNACKRAVQRGVVVLVCGTWDKSIRDLYPGWTHHRLKRSSGIGAKATSRRIQFEGVLVSHKSVVRNARTAFWQ